MTKPVLILKTGSKVPSIPAERGDFEDWIIAGSGLPAGEFHTSLVCQGDPPPAVETVSAVIVTGSPAMVTDGDRWITASCEYLVEAMNRQVPVLGICFGHQLLAHALGGKVDFHPRGREIGTTTVALTEAGADDRLFHGMPGEFAVNVSHMQSVLTLPPGAQRLAANEFEAHHAVRFADMAWGLQFHPEFNGDIMRGYLIDRSGRIEEEGLDASRLLAGAGDTPEAESLLKRFIALVSAQVA